MIALLEEGKNTHFPNPNKFDNKGLVAISQHLGVERILQAYRNGIFPWMKMEWNRIIGAGFLLIHGWFSFQVK